MAKLVAGLDPARYTPHFIHDETRAWAETNCYVDLWVETLHGLQLDPVAGLAFCVTIDLEGDQWTFFKYPVIDLEQLYGLEIIELNPWRALVDQIEEQVSLGRAVVVELDAWFMPDTVGNTYHAEHQKTSITVESIDKEARRLTYFHGAGYWALEGDDFDGIFRLGPQIPGVVHLPPYVEVAKLGRRPALTGKAQVDAALSQLRRHLARRPKLNPFIAYADKFQRDLVWLREADLATFHAYAFATMRQFGACFELLATFCRWLNERLPAPNEDLANAATDFDEISNMGKTMQFKLARAVRGKPVDFAPLLTTLTDRWTSGMERLDRAAAT